MQKAKILIADDERSITEGLSAILQDEGYAVDVAQDGQKALDRLASETYGVVLADLKMPKVDGLALLKELQSREITTECIIITGQATVDSAVQAMRRGAYDYIEKPLNAEKLNRLKALIPKAVDKFNVKQANRALTSELQALTHFGELTGQSEAMRGVYQIIDAVAPSTASVLITGESGTGKELVARAIHAKSERAKGPFFALNCAALPKDILENELFGHEKGAFTGSTNEKPGAFEMSDGGTLFLDEVAEMATPPLRERMGDIKLLASEFLERFSQQNGKKIAGFDDAAMDWILSYHWPGNVRELKNAVERAVIMARGPTIGINDILPRHMRTSGDVPATVTLSVGASLADAKRQLLLRTFAMTGGDQERTAKMLGMSAPEVRAELAGLLGGNGLGREAEPARAAAKEKVAQAKSKPKGR